MDFYRINEEYNQYLQRYEKENRGVTKQGFITIQLYEIPVPEECIERLIIKNIKDEKYRVLLNKEYRFCMDNAERIPEKSK